MKLLKSLNHKPRTLKIVTAVALALGVASGLIDPITASMAGGAMLSTIAHSAQGMTIAIAMGSPLDYTTIPEVVNINGPSGSASIIDATDLSSTAREKVMGLMDEGQVQLEINYLPDNAVHEYLRSARANKTLVSLRISFTDSAPVTTFTFSAYVTGFAVTAAVDALVKTSVTVEITGAVTKA